MGNRRDASDPSVAEDGDTSPRSRAGRKALSPRAEKGQPTRYRKYRSLGTPGGSGRRSQRATSSDWLAST